MTLDDVIADENPALDLQNLAAGYGRTTVVRNVNLQVKKNSITALIGPNGAGKSTLMKAALGLARVTHGSILLEGAPIDGLSTHQRAQRGMCLVPEGRAIYRNLSVRDNLVMQSAKGEEEQNISRATEAFPVLGKRLAQRASTLSGGEQQMLAMAAVFSAHPRVILVDEPSLGLAPLVVDMIFEFLRNVSREDISLLLVDQFATRALSMADSAYVLRHGEIAYDGSPQELLAGGAFEEYLGGNANR